MSEGRRNISRIKAALSGSLDRVKPLLKRLHPSDIAEILDSVTPESRRKIIHLLPIEQASGALVEMDGEVLAAELLSQLTPEKAAKLIEELDPDDAADLLAQIPKEDLIAIFNRLPDEDERIIEQLMTYGEETAGGIMNPEVFRINKNLTKREALQRIIDMSDEMEDFYVLYVVNVDNRFEGIVSIKDLLRAAPHQVVGDLLQEKVISVDLNTDQEEVARLMQKYDLPTIPVLDAKGHLVGRVTFDDILDVMQEESTEDLLKIAGVWEDVEVQAKWSDAVKSRIPWLLINLLTASIAGFVISLFQSTIQQMALITVFMPVIAGVAGNGATQTLAVTLRRIVTKGVSSDEIWGIIIKEITVGLMNGLLIGLVVSLIAVFTQQNPLLGVVVFLAMAGNLIIAGFAGSAVPLFLKKIEVDPAVASSILITAFTDILGYILLLGLGTYLLIA